MNAPNNQSPKRKTGSPLLTLGTYIFLLASLFLVVYFGYTYINPYHQLNPFPPAQPPETANLPAELPTEAPTLIPVSADTLTPIATLPLPPPTATTDPSPTATSPPFPTATSVVINTPEPTLTPETALTFTAQKDTPSYLPYSGGCTGLFIAGNITDIDDNPVMLMTVRASGTLGGDEILIEVLSGSNQDYTESGWEIKLSDTLINSSGSITVALYKQGAWEPSSEAVLIDTFNDCTRNLVVVNFVQN